MSETHGLAADLSSGIDPITYEVLANAFTAIVDDMGATVEKVSFSTVTTLGKDYACALALANGDVFARGAGGLPLLTGTVTPRIRSTIEAIGSEALGPGDVYLHNDPYLGGTHGQDVAAIMPIFIDDCLQAFVVSCSHWPDVGGAVPGSFNSEADSTHAECLLIPPTPIISGGKWNESLERLILRNLRLPEIVRGDLRGMVEACRTGHRELLQLVSKYGSELIFAEAHALIAHSEELARRQIEHLPDGHYSCVDYIDGDPGAPGEMIPVILDVTIRGDEMVADFRRSGDQAVGPVNGTRSSSHAAFMAGIKELFHEIPWNAGMERPIRTVFRARSVLDAEYPRPVSGVGASPAEKVIACVHGCFIQVVPERSMACPTNLVNISLHGRDSRPGRNEDFVMYLWLAGGWGGRPTGGDGGTSMFPLGPGTNLQPAESLERIYPILFRTFEIDPDSEGAGYHRGGFGFRCALEITVPEAMVNAQGDRHRYPGWGHAGGLPARGNGLMCAPGTPEERVIPIMSGRNRFAQGELLDFWQSGGGGCGDPLTRPAEWVLEDVRRDLLSVERARDIYGVALIEEPGGDLSVDQAATESLRNEATRRVDPCGTDKPACHVREETSQG